MQQKSTEWEKEMERGTGTERGGGGGEWREREMMMSHAEGSYVLACRMIKYFCHI